MPIGKNLKKSTTTTTTKLGIHLWMQRTKNRHFPTGSTQQVKPGIYWGKNVVDGGVDTGGVGTLNSTLVVKTAGGEDIGIYYTYIVI